MVRALFVGARRRRARYRRRAIRRTLFRRATEGAFACLAQCVQKYTGNSFPIGASLMNRILSQVCFLSSRAVLGVAMAAALFISPAHAESELPADTKFPYASLRAEAVREVARDTVRITLAAEVRDSLQAEVAASLSRTVDSVMQQLKGTEAVKIYSGNFQVWPMNDRDGRISDWRGRAEIILESMDFELASKLAASVSDRMPISNLDFSVAAKERARYEAELLEEAAAAFKERAEATAAAFGFASYTIREVRLGGAGASYQPEARRMMAMAADASGGIALEGGTERISLAVEGTIFLHSAKE